MRRRSPVVLSLVVAAALIGSGCTSTPPQPSAGTQTAQPTSAASASSATPENPPATGAATNQPTPSAAPTTVPTPAPTMPPADAIGAELATQGTLGVCMALLGAPAASLDQDGQPYGYNPAFAMEIASRLDLEPVIQQHNFDELVSMLQGHTCDISVSSQNITAERSIHVNLIPYTQSKSGFPVVVANGNPNDIASLTDLCAHKVSAATGTTNVDAVTGVGLYQGDGINSNCAEGNLPAVQLLTYDTELDAVQALLDGSVVAYLGNANYVTQYPDLLQKSSATLPSAEQGIAVALDHPTLTAAVDAALREMISDGTYLRILGQYLPASSVDNFSIIEAP